MLGSEPLLALFGALTAVLVLTPCVIKLAFASNFLDRPATGYKQHGRSTPYLGGIAVVVAVTATVLVIGPVTRDTLILLGAVLALCVVGTVDDRTSLAPSLRVGIEILAAAAITVAGFGWNLVGFAPVDFVITAVWIVGVVNAVNLMDNMDGASTSVVAAASFPIGLLALAQGSEGVAIIAFAVAGACLGFLPYNLILRPARVFLGDGGSMPLGLLLAVLAMHTADVAADGAAALLVAALLVGLVILDTTLVSVSRRRRGISLLTGGRDHLTHRLHEFLKTPRRVAVALVVAQTTLGAGAVTGLAVGSSLVFVFGFVSVCAGVAAIVALELHWIRRTAAEGVAAVHAVGATGLLVETDSSRRTTFAA